MNYELDATGPSEEEQAEIEGEENPEEEQELSEEEEQRLEEARLREEERERIRRKLKLVTPMVMLTAGAIVAIYLFLKEALLGDYLVIVFGTLLLFFIIGILIEYLITHFVQVNWYKEDLEREEAERIAREEEERLAREEAERRAEAEAAFSDSDDDDTEYYEEDSGEDA